MRNRQSARAVILMAIMTVAPPLAAADFAVDDVADLIDLVPGDGNCWTTAGTCTLRAAIQEANANANADTITLPADSPLAAPRRMTRRPAIWTSTRRWISSGRALA